MTVNNFIRKLLKPKGLLVTDFQFKFRDKELNLWVKPHKNGCLCPSANVEAALFETCRAIGYGVTFPSAGGLFSSGTSQERFFAPPMVESRKISPGPMPMRV